MTIDQTSSAGSLAQTQQSDKPVKNTTTQEVGQSPKANTQDEVKLSPAAHARHMKSSGQSVAAIASALGTDVKTVSQYLGIQTKTQPVPVAAPRVR